jgi:two-component system OmpR family response regulator
MRVLIAEDDSILADGLVRSLRQSGYAVDAVKTGSPRPTARSTGTEFDLLILDIGLPRMSGLEVLKRLRGRDSRVPVLILTALDGVQDRVRGLDLGADDYLAKPFQLAELEARVRALTRRGAAGAPTICCDTVHWPTTRSARSPHSQRASRWTCPARELALLEVLMQRAGRMVSKEQLVDHLCEWGEEVSTNAIEVYVHRLRKKLEPGAVRRSPLCAASAIASSDRNTDFRPERRRMPFRTFATPKQHRQTSLFGEILDWMLAPLMILWPISMAVEYSLAYSVANTAYDRELRNELAVIARQLTYRDGKVLLPDPVRAVRQILISDELSETAFQIRGP